VLLRLFEHPNYVIHKESTSRVGQVGKMLRAKPDASIMCCDSPNLGLVVPTMSLGGHGTANMSGNIIPAEMAQISKPWTGDADAENFKNAYLRNLEVLHFNYSAINPVAVKSIMATLGLPAGPFRKPLRGMDPKLVSAGVKLMSELGLIEKYGYQGVLV
jgi:4-hydroxy-tetrahydrodipicolinate synthase